MSGQRRWRDILDSRPVLRHVASVAGGTVLAQVIVTAISPIISRQYSPDSFGVFGVFSSLLLIFLAIAGFKFEMAIPLPQRREDAEGLVGLSIAGVVAVTVAATVWVGLVRRSGWLPEGLEGVRGLLWWLPAGVLLGGVFQVLRSWAGRVGQFPAIGRALAAQSAARSLVQVAAGFLSSSPAGLVGGAIAGSALGVRPLWARAGLSVRTVLSRATWALAREYRRFPLFTSTATLITTLGLNLPAIQLAEYFSMAESGHFSFSLRILGLPIVVLGQSVAQVFYPAAAERELDERGNREFISRVATGLAVIAIPVFALLALYGAEMFAFAFGSEWRRAGYYSQILAPMYLLAFVSSPVSSYAMVRGKQLQILAITILEALARFGAIWLGAHFASPVASVTAYSAVGCIIYLAYLAWVLSLSGVGLGCWLRGVSGYLVAMVGLTLPLALVRVWVGEQWSLVQILFAAAVLGGASLWRIRPVLGSVAVSSQREEESASGRD